MQPHPIDIHVGKRLRLRRTILGMSQEVLGNSTGVTFQQVQKYERGINRIGSSRLYEFARFLKVPVSFFFEDFNGEYDTVPVNAAALAEDSVTGFDYEQFANRETLELMRAYNKITDPALRRRVADLIKSLADVAEPA